MKPLAQSLTEAKSELTKFQLSVDDRKALNKAIDICKKLRKDYDWYYGRRRDDIMCGAGDTINGINLILNAQK